MVVASTRPVSERAIFERVQRALNRNGSRICRSRIDSKAYCDFGRYYTVDVSRNTIDDSNVDLAALARELNVMHESETIAE